MGPEIGELVPDGLDNDAVIRVKDWGYASGDDAVLLVGQVT